MGRRALAMVTSWILPGSGFVILGRPGLGFVWLAWVVALMARLAVTRMPGLYVAIGSWFGGALACAFVPRGRRTEGNQVFGAVAMLLVVAVAARFALREWWIEAFKIPAGSMAPTIELGDHIFVNKMDRSAERGDVVVFEYPPQPGTMFVKRVEAVAGDSVEHRPCPERMEGAECRVPPGHVFVVGDDLENSHDSRAWGPVPLDAVKGRAVFVWWSRGPAGVRWERVGRSLD